jgi:hypothetical protein
MGNAKEKHNITAHDERAGARWSPKVTEGKVYVWRIFERTKTHSLLLTFVACDHTLRMNH